MNSKQILVMRKFIGAGSRTGKYVAQGAHASLGAVFSLGTIAEDEKTFSISLENPFVKEWITGSFKKVAVYVETEAELIELYTISKEMGVACSLIRDSGLTEFGGVHTLTAVGIGPDDSEVIDKITGKLPLF